MTTLSGQRDDPAPHDTPTTTTPRGLRRATRHANETIAHTTRPDPHEDDDHDPHEDDEHDDLASPNINDMTPTMRTRRRRNSEPNTTTTPTQPPPRTPKARGKRKANTVADKNAVSTATAVEGATHTTYSSMRYEIHVVIMIHARFTTTSITICIILIISTTLTILTILTISLLVWTASRRPSTV